MSSEPRAGKRTVAIDSQPSSAQRFKAPDRAIVGVDVIRATTTVATALAQGRTVHLARSTDEAFELAARLASPILAGELGGNVPYGFDMTNSPVQVEALGCVPSGSFTAPRRPLILVSSSGVPLLLGAEGEGPVLAGCLRNISAVTAYLAEYPGNVAVLGAGTRGEFRREDQIGCALIASRLVAAGFEVENETTLGLIERWRDPDLDVIRQGNSAKYLQTSGHRHDLEFVVSHFDDLDVVPRLRDGRFEDALREPDGEAR